MASYCVLKNLPCAFLTFTIHYTFPIDHTLDLITLTVFYKDWILWLYNNSFPSCYILPLGSNYSLQHSFFSVLSLHVVPVGWLFWASFFHVACACRWYSSKVSATKWKCFRSLVPVNTTSCPRIQKSSCECFKWAYYCKATTSNFK